MTHIDSDPDRHLYVHLRPGDEPPKLGLRVPFKAVVIVESDVTDEWRYQVSQWLVSEGCRYMMAWGLRCADWDDSVMDANLVMRDHEAVVDERFVMTTWHEDETLQDTFELCVNSSDTHPVLVLSATVILHIADVERETELRRMIEAAEAG